MKREDTQDFMLEDLFLELGDSFKRIRSLGIYVLIRQVSTSEEIWIKKEDIKTNGIQIAYYDADPTFDPEKR